MLVNDFIQRFNAHRVQRFSPSDRICVDESMSRWYGAGRFWINVGLPQYIAIDRNPENGCEIQNAACGRSGVMMRLKLVKTPESGDASHGQDLDGIAHSTAVFTELVGPWAMSNRVVYADSYFASVASAEELQRIGVRFIGVVKTATKKFPMKVLSEMGLECRGNRRGLVSLDAQGHPSLLAFVWVDRDRRYFIASCSPLTPGALYCRRRWRQLADVASNELPERVMLDVPQPEAAEIYYETCRAIDRHNRYIQDDLMLERKIKTHDWSFRVNTSILGMCYVDSWRVYKGCQGQQQHLTQAEFYCRLADELIDNDHDNRVGMVRKVHPPRARSWITAYHAVGLEST
jgi:Transposase IS4